MEMLVRFRKLMKIPVHRILKSHMQYFIDGAKRPFGVCKLDRELIVLIFVIIVHTEVGFSVI